MSLQVFEVIFMKRLANNYILRGFGITMCPVSSTEDRVLSDGAILKGWCRNYFLIVTLGLKEAYWANYLILRDPGYTMCPVSLSGDRALSDGVKICGFCKKYLMRVQWEKLWHTYTCFILAFYFFSAPNIVHLKIP